jgi:hypothetical protein
VVLVVVLVLVVVRVAVHLLCGLRCLCWIGTTGLEGLVGACCNYIRQVWSRYKAGVCCCCCCYLAATTDGALVCAAMQLVQVTVQVVREVVRLLCFSPVHA